ncbi:hypothetical protein [Lentzea aerocolonigenes]|uniref:hypothetical protein n=1 Tax=Lentzea aerocolonigenes TaxID=68170 RepID=UPI0004C3EE56|nr:hypothetical protein [Lentzea aerocolonigenes]MCP2248754.1 hypothetical protein [Lentzea aerocolonigenes]
MSAELHQLYLEQARRAFGMYARTVEVQNEANAPMPTWDDLDNAEQVAWVAAVVELCRVLGADDRRFSRSMTWSHKKDLRLRD